MERYEQILLDEAIRVACEPYVETIIEQLSPPSLVELFSAGDPEEIRLRSGFLVIFWRELDLDTLAGLLALCGYLSEMVVAGSGAEGSVGDQIKALVPTALAQVFAKHLVQVANQIEAMRMIR